VRDNRILPGLICPAPPARYGLTTTFELCSSGLGTSAISKRVARGVLVRRYPGVYSYGPGELSSEAQAMAAVLAAGRGAVLGQLSSAVLWRTSRFPAPIPHVLVPGHHRPIEGIVLHSYRYLDPLDVTVFRGIPVTTVARMLVDLSDVLTKFQLANVIYEAAFRNRFNLAATRRAIARANGRHNLHVLEEAIALYLGGSAGTRSRVEDAFLHLLQFAGIPEPLVNTHLHGEEVDCHWPDRKLVVEVDGPGHRTRPAAKRNDARKDAKLRAAGYTVLRFTDVEIERRPERVLACLSGRAS
jgi:Protein of unknown function (DUF559)